jgi:hypothetical protein
MALNSFGGNLFMEILIILSNILDKPSIPRFYKELQKYYEANAKPYEAAAFNSLIENKFGKNANNQPSD